MAAHVAMRSVWQMNCAHREPAFTLPGQRAINGAAWPWWKPSARSAAKAPVSVATTSAACHRTLRNWPAPSAATGALKNCLHWVLDAAPREDECRARTGHAATNFATLRQDTTKKPGIRAKQKIAGWDHRYLIKLLSI